MELLSSKSYGGSLDITVKELYFWAENPIEKTVIINTNTNSFKSTFSDESVLIKNTSANLLVNISL